MNGMNQRVAAGQQGLGPSPAPTLVERVAKAVTDFNNQLSTAQAGALSQVWLPEVGEDGSIVLNTQGLPYGINGAGDLLALFRCISCKYKFSTDLTKPQFMGSVGRVFTSGEPEMCQNVQQYDKSVFLRAAEAQRCRISSAMFMPLFNSPKRDCVLGVFEVVQTEREVLFPAVVDWLRCCLREMGLFTADVDKHVYVAGLRQMPPEYNVSAFESGTAAAMQQQQQRNVGGPAALGAQEVGGTMGPPRWQPSSAAQQGTQQAPAQAVVNAEGENDALVPRLMIEEKRPVRLQARPSMSDPLSKKTTTGSAGAAQLAHGCEVPPGDAMQVKPEADEQGDTLMGSTGPMAGEGKEAKMDGELPPQQQQAQPAAAAAQPQEGGVLQALGPNEDDDDEVLQPAKVARSGQHPGSSLAMALKEEGEGVHTPATAAMDGVGRAGHPSGDPTTSPPDQLAARAGSQLHPSSGACGSGGVDQAPARQDAAAAAVRPAPAVGQPGNDCGAAGLPASAAPTAARMERVGTSGQLADLGKVRHGQGVAIWRSSSAPPIADGALEGAGTEPVLQSHPFWEEGPQMTPDGSGGTREHPPALRGSALGSTTAGQLSVPPAQQQAPQPPPLSLPPALAQLRTAAYGAHTPRPPPHGGLPPALQPQQPGFGEAPGPGGLPKSTSGLLQGRATPQFPSPAGRPSIGMPLMGSAAGGAADVATLHGGSMAPDMGRLPSGGVGQKNLTLEDLQPHFGYGLKDAAARLGICPTTLKRTCRRLGISRWPRRQLVRLTKQAAAAVKLTLEEPLHHPTSASDGSGGGEWGQQQQGVQLALGHSGGSALGSPNPTGSSLLQGNPALLFALQQAQQQGGGRAGLADGGPLAGAAAALVASPSLHQQLLHLQQQQQQQAGQFQEGRLGVPGQGTYGELPINPAKLAQLQQHLAAAAAGSPSISLPSPATGAGLPPLPPPSAALPSSLLPFVRSTPMGGASQAEAGAGQEPFRPQPLPPKGGARLGGGGSNELQWETQRQQQQQQPGSGSFGQVAAGPTYPFFGSSGGGQPAGASFGQGPVSQQPRQRLASGPDSHGGPAFSGLGGSPWQLPPRPGGAADAHAPGRGDANHYVELAAAAAAANMQYHLAGGHGGQLPRKHCSPSGPHTGFSLGSLQHLGGDFHMGGHSIESLDILAAADFDSVANSPRGVSHMGGLSNLGLSNFGVSNLDLPAGGTGLEFSVGGPFAGPTSSQRP